MPTCLCCLCQLGCGFSCFVVTSSTVCGLAGGVCRDILLLRAVAFFFWLGCSALFRFTSNVAVGLSGLCCQRVVLFHACQDPMPSHTFSMWLQKPKAAMGGSRMKCCPHIV